MAIVECEYCMESRDNISMNHLNRGFGECKFCGSEYCPSCGDDTKRIHNECSNYEDEEFNVKE